MIKSGKNKKTKQLPTLKIGKKAEKVAREALEDYKKGKTIKASSFEELSKL